MTNEEQVSKFQRQSHLVVARGSRSGHHLRGSLLMKQKSTTVGGEKQRSLGGGLSISMYLQ